MKPRTVLIGDSLMLSLFKNAQGVLTAGDRIITNLSASGHTVADQLAVWQASPVRGDASYACAVIQVGVNDLRKGVKLPDTLLSFATLIKDLRSANPKMKLILGLLLPARTNHDIVHSYETRYLPVQKAILAAGKGDIPAVDCIMTSANKALNDGTDALLKDYDSGDHLHPTPAGNRINAVEIRANMNALFGLKDAAPAGGGGRGQRQITGQWRAVDLAPGRDVVAPRALGETHAVQVRRRCKVVGFTCRLDRAGVPHPVRGSALAVQVVHVTWNGLDRPPVTVGTVEPGESDVSKAAGGNLQLEAGDLAYVRFVTDAAWANPACDVAVELITEEC
jgi:lysophospholipase L1-like esterase